MINKVDWGKFKGGSSKNNNVLVIGGKGIATTRNGIRPYKNSSSKEERRSEKR